MRISITVRLLLLLLFLPASAPAQQVRIPGASVAQFDLESILRHGDELRREGRWGELITHYEEALKSQPAQRELEQRLKWAEAYRSVARRYADSSYLESLESLSDRQAIDLYSEVLDKIHMHYVKAPSWATLVERGVLSLQAALQSELVVGRLLPHASALQLRQFHHELARHMGSRPVRDRREAREAAWFAAQLARQKVGLPVNAGILEFAAGSATALDHYSTFLTSAQLDEVFSQIEGNFVGLGIELESFPQDLKIVHVIPGGPADEAGLQAGDRIVQVDGQTVAELTADVAADNLRGAAGSVVAIQVLQQDGSRRQLRITRRLVEVPSVVDAQLIDSSLGVAYLKITSFQKSTSRDVDDALWSLHRQGMQSLIIDVRGNPGGLLNSSVEVADKFLSNGAIVSTRGRTEQFDFKAHDLGTWRVPLVVLIDGDSASASEIFAGAIRDRRRGKVVGTRSYGKGSVQGIFPLSIGKTGVRLTTAKFYSPSGREISNHGVLPDVTVRTAAKPALDAPPSVENDAVLAQAVDAARIQLSAR